MNSSGSLYSFVPLAFHQSGKVPQLLQPDGPGAAHIISSLRGPFPFHCFTHHGESCQTCVGLHWNSTRVPKSPLKGGGMSRPWASERGQRPKGFVVHQAFYSTQIIEQLTSEIRQNPTPNTQKTVWNLEVEVLAEHNLSHSGVFTARPIPIPAGWVVCSPCTPSWQERR